MKNLSLLGGICEKVNEIYSRKLLGILTFALNSPVLGEHMWYDPGRTSCNVDNEGGLYDWFRFDSVWRTGRDGPAYLAVVRQCTVPHWPHSQ